MKRVCVCVHTHSTFRDQASDSQRAHFPNVNISVKTWGGRVNHMLLNCERLRAPLSPRWHRARGGNQPLPPRFLKHCPFIKGKPPTAFLNLTIFHRRLRFLLNRDAPPFQLHHRGCLAHGRTPPLPFTANENSQPGQKHDGREQRACSTSLFLSMTDKPNHKSGLFLAVTPPSLQLCVLRSNMAEKRLSYLSIMWCGYPPFTRSNNCWAFRWRTKAPQVTYGHRWQVENTVKPCLHTADRN